MGVWGLAPMFQVKVQNLAKPNFDLPIVLVLFLFQKTIVPLPLYFRKCISVLVDF